MTVRQCMDSADVHSRLKKTMGQVQAADRMIDENVPCGDADKTIESFTKPVERFADRG